MGRPPSCSCHCVVPVPYPGVLSRYLYPTQIADYESLSSVSWSSGDFAEYYTIPFGVTTYGGFDFNYYYHVMTVPEESTDDVSVILQPIRYAITEPGSSGGNYEMWHKPTAEYFGFPDWYRGGSLASNTLLPVSDASHFNNTSPTSLRIFYMPLTRTPTQSAPQELWALHTIQSSPGESVVPINWTVRPKYMWIRKNGVAYESLVDFSAWNTYLDTATGYATGLDRTQERIPHLSFNKSGLSGLSTVAWDFDWVAGDTVEFDIWYEMHARPRVGSGTGRKYVVAAIPRHRTVNSAQWPVTISGVIAGGAYYSKNHNPQFEFRDIEVSVGLNPETHTYSFDHGTHDWHPGDGSAGTQKARNISAVTGSASYVSIGTAASGTGNVTPGLPAGWAVNDKLWLICETANETVSAPTGWTSVTNSPQGTGIAGGIEATALSVFWRRAETGDTDPTITDPGDHCIAQIVATRGGATPGLDISAAPYDVTAGDIEGPADIDPGEMPTVTTTVDEELVLLCAAYHQNLNLAPPLRFASFTNAGLTGITVHSDATYDVGNGGGLGIAIGTKTTAGSTGTTEVSWNESSIPMTGKHAFLTIAIKNIADAAKWTFFINSGRLIWYGKINGGTYDGYGVAYTLDWSREIATLEIVGTTPAGEYLTPWKLYRPQSSGDYTTTVTDRDEGSLVSGPCGVFNWLGTTVFERWDGPRAATYSPPAMDPFYPASITVVKANQ